MAFLNKQMGKETPINHSFKASARCIYSIQQAPGQKYSRHRKARELAKRQDKKQNKERPCTNSNVKQLDPVFT